MDSQLRQISTLVQERRYDEARAALQPYLRDHPNAANGWYLLSFAAETPAAKKQAVQKALKLAPDNEKYAARAAKLSVSVPRSPKVPLLIGGLVVIAIVAVVFVLLSPTATPTDATLPTLAGTESSGNSSPTPAENAQIAAVATTTDSGSQSTAESATPNIAPSATLVESETATESADVVLGVNDSISLTVAASSIAAELLNPPTAQSIASLPTSSSSQNGTQQPTQSAPQGPTSTPSQTPQPGVITATPVLTGDSGVPVSTPLDIGTGSMRVVGVTRPGSSFITEMGGQAADVPAGQDWVVLEMIVICSGSTNCAPDLSNLHVVSTSGATYAPAPDFSMPQLFGPGAFALGQVWGYAGFRVPTSESGLRLVLSQGDKTYTFALE